MKYSNPPQESFSLLTPVFDESFPSWILRCALSPSPAPVTEYDFYEWEAVAVNKSLLDHDLLGMEFDFFDSYGASVGASFGLDTEALNDLFGPSTELLLAPSHRFAYCHLCILNDVKLKRFPAWRKSWCYSHHAYCQKHMCALSYNNNTVAATKQWDAFTEGDLRDFLPGRRRSYIKRSYRINANYSRYWLTIKVQYWIDQLSYLDNCFLPGTQMLVESKELLRVVGLIFKVLLMPRTFICSAGWAREICTNIPSVLLKNSLGLKDRLEYGVAHAVPYERMSGLLFLGRIFKLYNKAELCCWDKLYTEDDIELPRNDLKNIGINCKSAFLNTEQTELRNMLVTSSEIHEFLSEFFHGFLS